MDDLLSLMESDDAIDARISSEIPIRPNKSVTIHQATLTTESSLAHENIQNQAHDRCNYSGFALSRAEVSNDDVTDLIEAAGCSFIKISQLSTMSTKMIEGQRGSFATIGIIKNASGSRVSRSGNAFSIMELASIFHSKTIECVPMMSLFLFGDAYAHHNSNTKVGDIVLLLGPELMSGKNQPDNKSNTLQSFKILSPPQMKKIGTSKDFHAALVANKRQATNRSVHNPYSKLKPASLNKMQELRAVHSEAVNSNQFRNNVNLTGQTKLPRIRAQMHISKVNTANNTSLTHNLYGVSNMNLNQLRANKQVIIQSQGAALFGKKIATNTKSSTSGQFFLSQNNNTFSRESVIPPKTQRIHPSVAGSVSRQPLRGVRLQGNLQRKPLPQDSTSGPSKVKSVFLDESNFDGSVAIPTPNKTIFDRAAPIVTPQQNSKLTVQELELKKNQHMQSVLESQKRLAQLLKDKMPCVTVSPQNRLQSTVKKCAKKASTMILLSKGEVEVIKPQQTNSRLLEQSQTNKKRDISTLLFEINQYDKKEQNMAEILKAKSIFSDEVDAHLFAKSRQAMLELEHKEELEVKKNMRKDNGQKVKTEYFCLKCHMVYSKKPYSCLSSGHQVKKKRSIEQDVAATENLKKSLLLSERKMSLGESQLTLGCGIEWTRYQGI